MKPFLISFILLLASLTLFAQSDLLKLQDKLVGLTPDSDLRDWSEEEIKSINEFWKIFKEIREREHGFDYLKGSAAFGFSGNTTKETQLFRLNGGISLSKGTYPQEFEFSTQLNILIDNGELQENLSNLRITYDRFIPTKKNPFFMEGYSFVNRRSNQYLGVNQRYEIGGGLIIAHWHKKMFGAAQEEYENYKSERIKFLYESDQIIVCEDAQCVPVKWKGLSKNDSTVFHKSQSRIANSIIKRNTPLRIGLLVGAFLEIESISHSDSLLTAEGKKFFSHEFKTSNKFRWELRPTIDFRISKELRFKIRPFLKLPLPGEWHAKVEGKKVADFRIDFPATMEIGLSDKFGLRFNYVFLYDNAPNSILVSDQGINNTSVYLTANKIHHYYNFQVTYQFK